MYAILCIKILALPTLQILHNLHSISQNIVHNFALKSIEKVLHKILLVLRVLHERAHLLFFMIKANCCKKYCSLLFQILFIIEQGAATRPRPGDRAVLVTVVCDISADILDFMYCVRF